MKDSNSEKENDPLNSKPFYKEEIKTQNFFLKFIKKGFLSLGLLTFSLLIGITISVCYTLTKDIIIPSYANNSTKQFDDKIAVSSSNDKNIIETSSDYVKTLINNVRKSVVSITTISEGVNFFNTPVQYEGIGSGIIFNRTSTDTFIVTNYHVIENASKIGVAIDDKDPIQAKIIGKDVNADLAVLSISNKEFELNGIKGVQVAKFNKSDDVLVGDYVIALGNSIGEGITSTFGIISSTSKEIISKNKKLNVMQTTAAINPGNSGGALINLKGEVIGINTTKEANNIVEGVGYTIGSSDAMPIIENIMNTLNPTSLGVIVSDLGSNNFSDDIAGGAIINEVIEGGSAHRAGLKAGDIITSINDVPIFSSSQLVEEVKKYKVFDKVKIKVIRAGELKTIRVKFLQTNN